MNILLFGITLQLIVLTITAPVSLYMGVTDGLWSFHRTISVAIGLPALTLLIFNYSKFKKSIIGIFLTDFFSIEFEKPQ